AGAQAEQAGAQGGQQNSGFHTGSSCMGDGRGIMEEGHCAVCVVLCGKCNPLWPCRSPAPQSLAMLSPRIYTSRIRRVLVMSSSGLASRMMKSALLPVTMLPVFCNCM